MRRSPTVALALALSLAFACQPPHRPPTSSESSVLQLDWPTSEAGDALVFPPPPDRRPRQALREAVTAEADTAVTVDSPVLDADGHFELAGQEIALYFSDRVHPSKGGSGPLLSIDPPVPGRTHLGPWSIRFVADAPFHPDTTYTVRLSGLVDDLGNPAAEGWEATFRADPRIVMAGKVLSYIPDPGKPRLVAVRPHEGSHVGRRARAEILFDQPVSIARARALVKVADEAGATIDVKLAHPARDLFDGVEVDRRQVVVVEPRRPLAAGRRLEIAVRDAGQGWADARARMLEVAGPPRIDAVDCAGWDASRCSFAGGVLAADRGHVRVVLSNPPASQTAAFDALSIVPRPRNLSVWIESWDPHAIHVSGDFRPSTRYDVRIDGALRDVYGGRLGEPFAFEIEMAPLPASVGMPEGQRLLTRAEAAAMEVVTRNVTRASLKVWRVEDRGAAWYVAQRQLGSGELPEAPPLAVFEIGPNGARDQETKTHVDLGGILRSGSTYLLGLEIDETAEGAAAPEPSRWSRAGRPPMSLVTVADPTALAVHARITPEATLVHVAELLGGRPIADAALFVDGVAVDATTDATGLAMLAMPQEQIVGKVLRVDHDGASSSLHLQPTLGAAELMPELRVGPATEPDLRGLVLTDRGAYRPGSTLHFRGSLRYRGGARLLPVAHLPVRLRVIDPMGKEVYTETELTDDMGSAAGTYALPRNAAIGRYRVLVEPALRPGEIAETTVQVAEFEVPRFAVDVTTTVVDRTLHGVVEGRYLFGAAMAGADASWSLSRQPERLPSTALTERLRFEPTRRSTEAWALTGTGTLGSDGTLQVDRVLALDESQGPQRFVLEAEVRDASHRAIAGRSSVVVHPRERYAGVRVDDDWVKAGAPVEVELGVVDREGLAVSGRTVEATLARRTWKRVRRPGPGGAELHAWHEVVQEVDRCTARSNSVPVRCTVVPERSGDYVITASVDGVPGGQTELWAWGRGGDEDVVRPDARRRLEVTVQEGRGPHAPGTTVGIAVDNPFPRATAIFTVERGAILHSEAREVAGGRVVFTMPVEAAHAPHVYATVTLLPRDFTDERAAAWHVGAVRIPIDTRDARLDVRLGSDRDRYAPRERARIELQVEHGGRPVEGAEVALAVVDEGALRLTDHHAPDPVTALRSGVRLDFDVLDTRHALSSLLERSPVGGDGGGDAAQSLVTTRQEFVLTPLWKPSLRTDARGRIATELDLPDNLGRFRITAVVLDAEGRGAAAEASFEVRKPLMLEPVVPRFALTGDRFEAAVMAHNGEAHDQRVIVALGSATRTVDIPAHSARRVGFETVAVGPGAMPLTFSVRDAARVERDRVAVEIPIGAPGIEERPRLVGKFERAQDIELEIPADVRTRPGDEALVVTLGSSLWPELGAKLEYLIAFPHGCLEQTTSSTLPLLAARDVLPRLGFVRWDRAQIDARIRSGLERLASMQTDSGGLAYWPGQPVPNMFGTAYAMRAVALAAAAGIEPPSGLLEGMRDYLQSHLQSRPSQGPGDAEVVAAIALALAEAQALPVSSADMLADLADAQGLYGLSSLALALGTLPHQGDRLDALLDRIEAAIDDHGNVVLPEPGDAHRYWGSTTRSRAQAALALARWRPDSPKLSRLVEPLLAETSGYTTQSTAHALLALREHVLSRDDEPGAVRALLDGVELQADPEDSARLGPGARRYRIPLEAVRGRRALLRLETTAAARVGFSVDARWLRGFDDPHGPAATSEPAAPDIFRIYTDPQGAPIDPQAVSAGQLVRVTLVARLPHERLDASRIRYLALTDRIPAGFEPVQPDLWTVARPPDLPRDHALRRFLDTGNDASHFDLRDDRVYVYFDQVWGEHAAATYLMRATTPGTFAVPPTLGELMYEPGSLGYGDAAQMTVVP